MDYNCIRSQLDLDCQTLHRDGSHTDLDHAWGPWFRGNISVKVNVKKILFVTFLTSFFHPLGTLGLHLPLKVQKQMLHLWKQPARYLWSQVGSCSTVVPYIVIFLDMICRCIFVFHVHEIMINWYRKSFVIDEFDFTSINSCKLYSLVQNVTLWMAAQPYLSKKERVKSKNGWTAIQSFTLWTLHEI